MLLNVDLVYAENSPTGHAIEAASLVSHEIVSSIMLWWILHLKKNVSAVSG